MSLLEWEQLTVILYIWFFFSGHLFLMYYIIGMSQRIWVSDGVSFSLIKPERWMRWGKEESCVALKSPHQHQHNSPSSSSQARTLTWLPPPDKICQIFVGIWILKSIPGITLLKGTVNPLRKVDHIMQIVRKYGRKEGQNIYISLEADVDCETRIMIFKVFDLTKLSYVIRR